MRLFVAVYPPPDALANLRAAVEAVRPRAGPGWRFAAADQWHLTLRFVGLVPDDRLPALQRRLHRVAAAGPIDLRLAGAGTFGRHAYAQVLWVGLAGQVPQFVRLARACGADDTHPHLTVARARSRGGADATGLLAGLQAYRGPSWTAGELVLVRSQLGPVVEHVTVATFPLRGAPAPAAGA